MMLNSSKISCKILEVILQSAGHLVVSFGDSMEVLQVLPRREPADMLFLDIDLPKTDGFPEGGRSTEVARQWGVGRWDAPKRAER